MFPQAELVQFKVIKILEARESERVARAIQRAAINGQDAFRAAALFTSGFTRPPMPARQDISAAPSRESRRAMRSASSPASEQPEQA